MFKRWVILLLVLLAGSAASFYYHSEKSAASWVVLDECRDYLDTLSSDWNPNNDTWFYQRCELDNPISDASLESEWRERMNSFADISFESFGYILLTLFLSFIARWLVTGRLKWN
jgi:hypothetical protein